MKRRYTPRVHRPLEDVGHLAANGFYKIWIDGKGTAYKHRYFWEKSNGPVPAGQALRPLDGDRSNWRPSNWELIDKSVYISAIHMMNRHQLPAETMPTLIALARLKRRLRLIEKNGRTARAAQIAGD